jgi:hypothetical protein
MKSITLGRNGPAPRGASAERSHYPRTLWRWLQRNVPRGWELSDEAWTNRHRGILVVLWAHVFGVFIFGLTRGVGPRHVGVESAGLAMFAITAGSKVIPRRWRTIAVTLGLLSSSAVLVHLSGGSIEMHFHFFVMVPLVALYQDWVPFSIAIGFVALHHGLVGHFDPHSVFNHPAALHEPWKWAAIHAFFFTGTSIVCLVTLRLTESALES